MNDVQKCRKCGIKKELSVEFFYKTSGFRLGYNTICKLCHAENNRKRWHDPKNKVPREANYEQWKIDNIQRIILNKKRSHAKEYNFDFNLELNDIIIPKYCPVFGIELKVVFNTRADESISVDRINSNLGYIKGNIIIVSWKANRLKGEADINQMKLVYDNYYKIDDLNINHELDYYKKYMYYEATKRAKKKNIEFDIQKEDIVFPTHCPILNIEIKKAIGFHQIYSPSLDRIDNIKGYVKNNIRIISYKANELKNDSSYKDYETLYFFYKKLIEQKN